MKIEVTTPMTPEEQVRASEFLLRNWRDNSPEGQSELIDQLWYIIVENKYKGV